MKSNLIISVATVLTLFISAFAFHTSDTKVLTGDTSEFTELADYANFDEVTFVEYSTNDAGETTLFIEGSLDGVSTKLETTAKLFDAQLRCPCYCGAPNPKDDFECVQLGQMSACLPCSDSPFTPGGN